MKPYVFVSMFTGRAQVRPLNSSAFPALSTAAQKLGLLHDTPVMAG